jgi:ribosomal protein L11 methyltransferase
MNYIQVEIESFDEQQKEILLALLAGRGYEGFEEDAGSLKAFVTQKDFNEAELKQILKDVSYHISVIEEKNWNQEWESNFQPVIIDDFCAIRAEFHQPINDVAHEIVITPKMSFGTGHHPTTEMMIRMMRVIDFENQRVLDFGTGTGLLAILAEKLGASEITAADNDDWSIENAGENVEQNNCSKIKIEKASSIPANQQFDIILANIIKTVILANLPSMAKNLAQDGTIVLSGLLREDEKEIQSAAGELNLSVKNKIENGNWICLKLQYEQHITSSLN